VSPVRDLGRVELMKQADEAIKRYPGAVVHFKFTCPYCGERCMLQEPNKLYENGICHKCGKESPIERGGFALILGGAA
jgi:hypothetical protein